jgi:hypothetical protein
MSQDNICGLRKVYGNLGTHMTVVQVFVVQFNGFMSLTSYFDKSTDNNITETTYSFQFQYEFGNQ